MKLGLSGSQTVGPYYSIGLNYLCTDTVPSRTKGETFQVRGRVLDATGTAVPDAMLEIWQAGADGAYVQTAETEPGHSPLARPGFARIGLGAEGEFTFTTTRPGAVPYDDARMQAPHLLVLVYMRGLLRNLVTRMYFPDEAANAADPVLQLVPEERRNTLVARSVSGQNLEWNILLQGENETVFFRW